MTINKRNLIKLNDKYWEMKDQPDGTLKAYPISEEDLLEISLLDDGIEECLKNDINRLTNQAYTELQESFKRDLKGLALTALGFSRDTFNRNAWSIDHCNQRMSDVSSYLTQEVRMWFQTEAKGMIEELIPVLAKEVAPAIKKEFKENYLREVRNYGRNAVATAAHNMVSAFMKTEIEKLQQKAVKEIQESFFRAAQLKSKKTSEPDNSDF